MADTNNLIAPIEGAPEAKSEKGPASLARRSLVALATAVALSGAAAQTTPVRAEGGTVVSAVVSNPEYDKIIAQIKPGETMTQLARRMVKEGQFTMQQYADFVAYERKKDELTLARKTQEGEQLDQAIIAKREEGRGLDQEAIRIQQAADAGNLKIIQFILDRKRAGKMDEEAKEDIRKMYLRQTTSAKIRKILEENFTDIVSPLVVASR